MNICNAPTLGEQFPDGVTVIPNDKLNGWGRKYNGSVILFGGKKLFAYRKYNESHHRCDIGVADVSEGYDKVSWSKSIDLPCPNGKEHYEDPRLFLFRGELWLAVSMITDYNLRPWISVQKAFRLNANFEQNRELIPLIGMNKKAQEKNWQFFDYKGRLMVSYMPKNNTVYELNPENGDVLNRWSSDRIAWGIGSFSGGTPPIRYGNGWMSFFHGFSECLPSPHFRRYYFGAYTFEYDPPFAITGITPFPVGYASRQNLWFPHPKFYGWEPEVVFPAGTIVSEDGEWIDVSVGVNDCYTAVVKISTSKLDRMIVTPGSSEPRYYLANDVKPYAIPALLKSVKITPLRIGNRGNISGVITLDPKAIEYMDSLPCHYCSISSERYFKYVQSGTPKDILLQMKSGKITDRKERSRYGFS